MQVWLFLCKIMSTFWTSLKETQTKTIKNQFNIWICIVASNLDVYIINYSKKIALFRNIQNLFESPNSTILGCLLLCNFYVKCQCCTQCTQLHAVCNLIPFERHGHPNKSIQTSECYICLHRNTIICSYKEFNDT